MYKFVALFALVAAASARPQTINYEIPGGQASLTLGPASAPAPAKAQVVQVAQAPQQYFRIAQAPTQVLRIAQAQPQYQLVSAAPAQQTVLVRAAPAPAPKPAPEPEPFDANPQYSYSYNVNDAESGDAKSASETRDGDKVTGSYSVVEADGATRTVTYTADAENGFNAKVERTEAAAPKVVVAKPAPVRVAVAPAPVQTVRIAAPAPAAQQYILVQQPSALQSSGVFGYYPAGLNSASLQGLQGIQIQGIQGLRGLQGLQGQNLVLVSQ